jgi:hypothetical protein
MVNVTQPPPPAKEVPTEVLADAIVAISQGIQKLRSGRLNDPALYLLIQHAAPTVGFRKRRVGISEIKAVLRGIEALSATYLRKQVKAS